MSVDCQQLADILSLVKEAQEAVAKKKRHAPPRRKKRTQPAAYPDYGKSLVGQMETDPARAGLLRGAQTASLGAILGGLIGHMVRPDLKTTGIGAGAGALAGGIPGLISGVREAASEKSRLLALRRLGIDTPAELNIAQRFPDTLKQLIEEGNRL